MPTRTETTEQRLKKRIRIDAKTGCWNWIGACAHGYGRITVTIGGKRQHWQCHRMAYTLFVGPVAQGKELHHLCENKVCCNPQHLLAVTRREHQVDLTPGGQGYKNARKERCKHGHPFVPGSFTVYRGMRRCKQCAVRRAAEYAERHRAAYKAYQREYQREYYHRTKHLKSPTVKTRQPTPVDGQ